MKKRVDLNSIIFRLFLLIVLFILPIIVSGIFLFNLGKRSIKTEIESNAYANVSYIKKMLEAEILNIKNLQYELSSDKDLVNLLISYLNAPRYEYYYNIASVQKRLSVMKNSNILIEDISVYYSDIKRTISVKKGYSTYEDAVYLHMIENYSDYKYPLVFEDGLFYSIVGFPPVIKSKIYMIEVTLSAEKIRDILMKSTNISDSEVALYDHSSHSYIFGDNLDARGELLAEKYLSNILNNISFDMTMYDNDDYFIVSNYSEFLNVSILEIVPKTYFHKLNRYSQFLWGYSFLSITILAIYSYLINKNVKFPLDRMISAFKRLETGDMAVRINQKAASEYNHIYDSFNAMAEKLNVLIDNNYKQKIYMQKAELKQLQSQINPHFLYNSMFILSRLIKSGDKECAYELSQYMGTYFRFITRTSNSEVTLEQEVAFVYSYVSIQHMRFSRQWDFVFGELPKKFSALSIPRMILQPIVENAIEHGLKDIDQGGLLKISFSDEKYKLIIVVEDNGLSLTDKKIHELNRMLMTEVQNAEVTALINVHRRLKLRYGNDSGIIVSISELGGLKVEIVIMVRVSKAKPQRNEKPGQICCNMIK